MVHFNRSVKVLGYYLSDEERALKQHWSAENHERMVALKRALKRQKLIQHKENRQSSRNKEYGPLKTLDLLIELSPASPEPMQHIRGGESKCCDDDDGNRTSHSKRDDDGDDDVEPEAEEEEEQKEPASSTPFVLDRRSSVVLAKTGTTTADRRKVAPGAQSASLSQALTNPASMGAEMGAQSPAAAASASSSSSSYSAGAAAAAATSSASAPLVTRPACIDRPRIMEVRLRPVLSLAAPAVEDQDSTFDNNVSDCERWSSLVLGLLVEGSCLAIETVRTIERKLSNVAFSSASDEWMDINALSCLSNTFR